MYMDHPEDMKFHPNHSKSVLLKETGTSVRRTIMDKIYRPNIVYSSKPLNPGKTFTIKITEAGDPLNDVYKMCKVGLTSTDPGTLGQGGIEESQTDRTGTTDQGDIEDRLTDRTGTTDQGDIDSLRDREDTWLWENSGSVFKDSNHWGEVNPKIYTLPVGLTISITWSRDGIKIMRKYPEDVTRAICDWSSDGPETGGYYTNPPGRPWSGEESPTGPLWVAIDMMDITEAVVINAFPHGCEVNEAVAWENYGETRRLLSEGCSITNMDYYGNLPISWAFSTLVDKKNIQIEQEHCEMLDSGIGDFDFTDKSTHGKVFPVLMYWKNYIQKSFIQPWKLSKILRLLSNFVVLGEETLTKPQVLLADLLHVLRSGGDRATMEQIIIRIYRNAIKDETEVEQRKVAKVLKLNSYYDIALEDNSIKGDKMILFCLLQHDPYYFRHRTSIPSDILKTEVTCKKVMRIASQMLAVRDELPKLRTLCVACVRNIIITNYPQISVVLMCRKMEKILPKKILALLRMESIETVINF